MGESLITDILLIEPVLFSLETDFEGLLFSNDLFLDGDLFLEGDLFLAGDFFLAGDLFLAGDFGLAGDLEAPPDLAGDLAGDLVLDFSLPGFLLLLTLFLEGDLLREGDFEVDLAFLSCFVAALASRSDIVPGYIKLIIFNSEHMINKNKLVSNLKFNSKRNFL